MQANRPSRTAYKVALNIITLGSKPEMDDILPAGIVDVTEELLIKSGTIGERTAKFARSKWAISLYEGFDWMLPGQFEAFAFRKSFCETQVREAIRTGATQVLVLGAGYDTLGFRLAPEFSDVCFFEIDHPATARLKLKGIKAMGKPDNLHFMAEDLGQKRLSDVLQQNRVWNLDEKAVIIAEGLVMYLPPGAVQELFEQCDAVTGPGSRIAFSYIHMGEDGRPDAGRYTGLMLWLQKITGEPWIWSITPEALPAFLKSAGWTASNEFPEAGRKHGVEYFAVGTK